MDEALPQKTPNESLASAEAEPKNAGGGLTSAEARVRLATVGPNALPEPRRHPALDFLKKFWAPVPWMLEVTLALELVLGKKAEAAVIGALLLFNGLISMLQERKAANALALLRKSLPVRARVMRDGRWQAIDARSIVPGDLIYLRNGDLVPADSRVVEGHVSVDQSTLTGESQPVELAAGQTAHAASTVTRGEASAEVAATGSRTSFGRTADLVSTAKTASHLQAVIFHIVKYLVLLDVALVLSLMVFAWKTGLPMREMAPFGLILLVASVPVALPATFTLATALGSEELAKAGVLVTRLSAIEEAAAMDLLFSDKTGTLTENRLAVKETVVYGGTSVEEMMRRAAYASDAGNQDPLDLAILQFCQERNLEVSMQRRESFSPFDPATKKSEAVLAEDGKRLLVVKGYPAAIAEEAEANAAWKTDLERLANKGYRVLAVASGAGSGRLQLNGLIGFEDPPRADSAKLVSQLRELGVRVVMVTGDSAATAASVAEAVGIGGRMCDAKTVQSDSFPGCDVFAGVYPEDKVSLVRAAQSQGHVCGMTGDGVNDAPALKQAEAGIAVANATDVAKGAASLVLTTGGLGDVVAAIEVSRKIYQRMLTYTLNKIIKTVEIGLFLTLGVMLTGTFVVTPFLIVLLLFTNDFVTMSIATDNVMPSAQPDRWDIGRLMITAGILAGLQLLFSGAMFVVARKVLKFGVAELQTLVFVLLVFSGQGMVYLVRERRRFWASRPSRFLLMSSAVDVMVVAAMAGLGVWMAAIPWLSLLGLVAALAVFLVAVDGLKVRLFSSVRKEAA